MVYCSHLYTLDTIYYVEFGVAHPDGLGVDLIDSDWVLLPSDRYHYYVSLCSNLNAPLVIGVLDAGWVRWANLEVYGQTEGTHCCGEASCTS